MRHLVYILFLVATGCASFKDAARTSPTPEEWITIVGRARTTALESGLVKEVERTIIETSAPKVTSYLMSGVHHAQYFIKWRVSEDHTVLVFGQGSMLTLDGAKVKRVPNQSSQATAASRLDIDRSR